MHFYYAKRDYDRYLEKSIDFVLPFPLAATIPFYRFTEIRVSLKDVCKGLKLVWVHLGKIDFEEFAIHDHLCLSGIVGSF